MSLQVWLPLTKDIRNQGLIDATINGSGTLVDGKIGKAYKNAACVISNLGNLKVYPMTITFWAKTLDGTATWQQICMIDDTSNTQIHGIYVADSARLKYEYSPSVNANNVAPTEWHHYTFIINNGASKVYVDGELNGTSTEGVIADTIGRFRIGSGTNVCLNDFRIYDNCLSEQEIKEISKGLVLHYLLSDSYVEATTNLVTTEDGLSNTCYNGATSKYGYGTNTDMYKTLGTFEGRKGTKVYMGTAGLSAYPYVYFDAFNASGTTIHTLSFDYFPTLQNTIIPYSYNGTYNFSYTTDTTSGSATNVSSIIIPVEVGKWNHITITAQKNDTTNTSRGIGYIRIGSASHTSTTSNYWLFANVQVEAKDHATGYAGVGGTRVSSIVYDCSGFCNNGTINGNLNINSDTPKYAVSTVFPSGSNYIDCGASQSILPTDGLTVSLWCNYSTWGNPASCTEGGGWNFEDISDNGIQFPVYVASVGYKTAVSGIKSNTLTNNWHMITGTFDKTNVKIYIDGELKGTTATSSTNGIGYAANHCYVAAEAAGSTSIASAAFVGKISDVRIYATALSADDVLSLYKNSHLS